MRNGRCPHLPGTRFDVGFLAGYACCGTPTYSETRLLGQSLEICRSRAYGILLLRRQESFPDGIQSVNRLHYSKIFLTSQGDVSYKTDRYCLPKLLEQGYIHIQVESETS